MQSLERIQKPVRCEMSCRILVDFVIEEIKVFILFQRRMNAMLVELNDVLVGYKTHKEKVN
jgi:hypothetical protein